MYLRPDTRKVLEATRGEGAVRKVRQPPSHRFGGKTGIGLAPAVNQSVAGIVTRQTQAFLVEFFQQRSRRLDFWTMLLEQRRIARVVVIPREQGERHPELRGLRAAHVDHSFFIDEIAEVVVDDLLRGCEPAPFQIGVDGAGENVLKAVVLRTVIVAIDGSIFWIDAAGTHHQFARDGVPGHVHIRFVRK